MYERNASYLAKHSELGPNNSNKTSQKIIQKALNRPSEHAHFPKFFGKACPRTFLELFVFLNQLQISSFEKKKQPRNQCGNYAIPPPFKNSCHASWVLSINIFQLKGVSFVAKLQWKTPMIVTPYCDSIIPLHFCFLFANKYLKKNAC